MLNDEQLKSCNQRGLIPGPSESPESYFERITPLLSKKESSLKEVESLTHCLFDIKVDWVTVEYSNKSLAPWQGAATWITTSAPIIQLRKSFLKGSFLGYPRKEVLSHELAHAARERFEEPRFEEIFAYRTSKNRFRRYVSPLFQHPWEATLFLLLLIPGLFFNFFALLPLIFLTFMLGRLYRSLKILEACEKNLESLFSDPSKASALSFRLTDAEINLFSQDLKNILPYINSQKTIRWKLIKLVYF